MCYDDVLVMCALASLIFRDSDRNLIIQVLALLSLDTFYHYHMESTCLPNINFTVFKSAVALVNKIVYYFNHVGLRLFECLMSLSLHSSLGFGKCLGSRCQKYNLNVRIFSVHSR